MDPTKVMILASVVDKEGGLEVPSIEEMFRWPEFLWKGTVFGLNKVGVLYILAAVISFVLWMWAARRSRLVPRGLQAIMEPLYEFVRNNIAIEVMGIEGVKYVPLLGAMFTFILLANWMEVTPPILFPPTSSIAIPGLLAVMVFFIFNIQGVISQGLYKYYKEVLVPPGVPIYLAPLVALIELVSTFFVRPFSLAVRLFANMVAGHVLVTMFLVFSLYNFGWPGSGGDVLQRGAAGILIGLPSLLGAVAMFGFEIFVGFIQAFIFTILTAVYISDALHGH